MSIPKLVKTFNSLKNGIPDEITWWVQILNFIDKNPGTTASKCNASTFYHGYDDRVNTNIWAELVRRRFVDKVRNGRTFQYYTTEKGKSKIAGVRLSLATRGYYL